MNASLLSLKIDHLRDYVGPDNEGGLKPTAIQRRMIIAMVNKRTLFQPPVVSTTRDWHGLLFPCLMYHLFDRSTVTIILLDV